MNRIARQFTAILPFLDWGRRYTPADFRADLLAGSVVLFVTVPQVIAYAFLAGMPAEAGLYAALFALVGYAFFGASRVLSVGPTAIVAMMTLEIASLHANPGGVDYVQVVVQLSFLTGITLIALRMINFGSVVSFLSHAVVTGFIFAAAVLIIGNQMVAILGLPPSAEISAVGVANHLFAKLSATNYLALLISVIAILFLVVCGTKFRELLSYSGLSESLVDGLVKSAPMYLVILGVLGTRAFHIEELVPVVGHIPASLPEVGLASISFETIKMLGPSAFLIALVVFMESTSIGTALASKSRESIDANQELIALGSANIGSSLAGAFPVAGSFARSAVNFSSGAVTPVASLITAALVLLTILLLTPFFYALPTGVLAAIIVVSAWQLIDIAAVKKIFLFSTTDAVTFTCTFIAVLVFGVQGGLTAGVLVSFVLLIRSSSKPNIVVVGRVGGTEHFRNVERYDVNTSPKVLAIRVDESLYFVNTRFIKNFVFKQLETDSEFEHVLLICTATNFIDVSGLEMLEELSESLYETGVTLHLAEVKGPVMDKLKETSFYRSMHGEVFLNTNIAMRELAET